jgi:hypothetical protein
MYNWIRRHSGRVKPDVTTHKPPICEYSGLPGVESYNDSGSNKNNKENEMDNNNTIQSNEYSSKESDTK